MTTTPTPAAQPISYDSQGNPQYERGLNNRPSIIWQPSPACSDTTTERVAYVADVASRENPKLDALKAKYPARSDKDAEREKFSRTGRCVATGSARIIIASAITVEWADRIAEALAAKAQESAPSGEVREAFDSAFLSWNGFHTKAELDAEWSHGTLAGEMFRAGAALARRATAAPSGESIDTPEFQQLVEYWRNEPYGSRAFENAWAAIIGHIDARGATAGTTAAPAEGSQNEK